MSIFGKLRRAKQAADSQKDKKTADAESKPKPAPYRHVPTHAATDALLGAPATWREEDKKAIQAQRQKRNQYQLSRNPSSLSNVTTLNRDQRFTSTEWAHSSMDQRKNYSADWAPTTNAPRKGHVTPTGWSSSTNFSRRSQLPPQEHPSTHTDIRRSRFDMAESGPPGPSATEGPNEPSYKSSMAPLKDVKFYLPSNEGECSHYVRPQCPPAEPGTTEISPSLSEDNSNSSSRDSSCECRAPHLVNVI
jgi:hypothetical protein